MVSGDELSGSAYIFGTLAVASAAKYAFGAYTRWQKLQRFELVGHVSALNVFPVKSCGGISVQRALGSRLGLRVQGVTDRHWMVTRPNGDFLSQRQEPKMSLLKASFHGDQVFVDGPGMPTLKLPINPTVVPSQVKKCRVWEWTTEGLDCGQEAADWMCSFLGKEGLRVLFSAPGLHKRESSDEIKPWGNPALLGDQSAYSDFGAYLLLSEESLNFLNSNLNKKVTMRNFRPNIVVSTNAAAFDEDNWQEIKVGDKAYMRMLDPCTRCIMTTVNGDLGEKSKDGEPLATLKRLRCFPAYGTSPIFGVNCAVDVEGTINVGDPDNWQEIKVGDKAYMRMLDPCTRCIMTTVNGDLGEKSKDGEPLATLKRLRCFPAYGTSPIFGVNCAVDVEGTINVGDPVYALRK